MSLLRLYGHISELKGHVKLCAESAINALSYSYSPYSKFKVGAAVINNGKCYIGANQENASYPLCVCAERVALYNAAMQDCDLKITMIAITAKSPTKKMVDPVMPCGACRQVILEYEERSKGDIEVLFVNDEGMVYGISTIKLILPHHFEPSSFTDV